MTRTINRIAAVLAALATAAMGMAFLLLASSGVVPGASPAADERKQLLVAQAERAATVEGVFLDRYGDNITLPNEPGKAARAVHPEAYSYLLGYSSEIYGQSGLRARYQTAFGGGKDHVGPEIRLTIDSGMQQFAYDLLAGTEGSCVILDAETGEVLALTSRSDAELGLNLEQLDSAFQDYLKRDAFFLDRAVRVEDPPGSTFKLVTAAALIENGVSGFTCDDCTELRVGGTVIHNFGGAAYRSVDLKTALQNSVNVYFAKAGLELGAEKLADTARRFLYGVPIETDFGTFTSKFGLGERTGHLQLASTALGQGETATCPLHISMMMTAVLNRGVIMTPHVIDSISDDGKTSTTKPETASRAISAATAEELKRLLHNNALSYGFDESYGTVYAKTGTADTSRGNHVYILAGVEDVGGRKLAICLDQCNTTASSVILLPKMRSLLQFLQSY